MARSVTGLFAAEGQLDSAYGALRVAGFEPTRITIASPAGQAVQLPDQPHERRHVGAWLVEHLVHHGHPAAQAQAYHDSVAHEGLWLLSVTIGNDEEDADARNSMVTAGVEQISAAADGKMVSISRPGEKHA
jgi:hypothetical protein